MKPIGLFGKLPAHGDFIYRDLPSNFINTWDAWLQGYVGSSQEQIGESWLEIYLTSPIWRFAFSEGVIDQYVWAGIMLPSVDRVGRYFPFSIATRLPSGLNPLELINQNRWFESVEDAALQALEGQLQIDDLVEEINRHRLDQTCIYTPAASSTNKSGSIIKMDFEEQSPHSMYSWLLDASLRESLSSYSVWSTQGSQQLEPCLFYSRGLPQMRGIAAMMDGQWDFRGWHEPYRLKPVQQ
ncbi:type VI secretion system-associated protein TagF [Cellvibrio sp. PSBB006]|jgi:type VI secretion system protein ImpM|uniref:type VI secretion system-associated protein TagF n=1 Tax=Cellvibrio sp. PSBB006 TaxID=1987723 RepID=UPI000B3B1E4B|nr:type VI secretion system-associated protein TagF [Cellvibrio sp. PSBB006]ARU29937.1 type VI secretion-associated protein [Cellvibrio sp. PSBB006]